MDISALLGSSNTGQTAKDTETLVENYETFLTLLTTQLKHQDPLDPVDGTKFTEQLVQFSSVEQQIRTNSQIAGLLESISASNAASLVSYIGKEIEAEGAVTQLRDGTATWQLQADAPVSEAQVAIRNSAGSVVATTTLALSRGSNQFVWDGQTDDGVNLPDGAYQITVVGNNAEGSRVPITTSFSGRVTAVDFSGPETILKVGDIDVPLSAISAVKSSL